MNDKKKTKAQLINELAQLRKRLDESSHTPPQTLKSPANNQSLYLSRENFVNNTPLPCLLTASDLKILNANPAAASLIDQKFTFIKDKFCYDVFENSFCSGASCPFIKNNGEYLNSTAINNLVLFGDTNFNVTCAPIFDLEHQLQNVIIMFSEVTTDQVREDSLIESDNPYRTLAENALDGMYIVTPNGFQFVNPAFEKLTGYRAEEICRKDFDFMELIHPEDKAHILTRKKARTIGQKLDSTYIFRICDKNKQLKFVEANTVPLPGSSVRILGIIRDVTYRQRIETELHDSEEKYRLIVENLLVGTYITQNHILKYCNPKLAEMFGYDSPEKMTDMHVKDLVTTESWAIVDEQVRLRESGIKKVVHYFFQGKRKDGTSFDIEAMGARIIFRGKPAIQGSLRDISRQKQAENALIESEEKYRLHFENVNDVIFSLDPDFTILSVSPSVEKILGYRQEELKAKNLSELNVLPSNYLKIAHKNFQQILNGEDTPVREIEFICKNGSRVIGEINSSAIKKNGKIIAILCVARNITERKKSERLLQIMNRASLEMEKSLTQEDVFNAVSRALLSIGYSCLIQLLDENGKTLYPSHLGYDSKFVTLLQRINPVDLENYQIDFEKYEFYREIIIGKKTLFFKNIEPVLVEIFPKISRNFINKFIKLFHIKKFIVAPLIENNKTIGIFSVQSDQLLEEDIPTITAFANQIGAAWKKTELVQELKANLKTLKTTQRQLLQAQKMEAIGRLASGIAHDFNNILTAIMAYAELLLIDLEEENILRSDILEIKKAAERAVSLTSQLLAFSRNQPVEPQIYNINEIIRNTKNMLKRLIGEDICLTTILHAKQSSIKADRMQIEQIIMNLAINAYDAMPNGGELIIQTENKILDQEYCEIMPSALPGEYIHLTVRDTGIGMDEKTLSRIFDPFFTTKTKEKGTGLGLSVIYGIIQQHDGCIFVESEINRGSTFNIYLPVQVDEENLVSEAKIELDDYRGNGERILIVEDEESLLKLAARTLHESGYQIFQAGTSKEAMDIFYSEQGQFHLIFCDVVLPDLDGLSLVDNLIADNPNLIIIFTSGYTGTKSRLPEISKRGYSFLQKPYLLQDLVKIVKEKLVVQSK